MRAAVLAVTALILLVGGCGDSQEEPAAEPGLSLRLVIPDANIREPEAPCSGAGAFRFAHAQAGFVVEDPSGRQVAAGSLPEGRAEKAFNLDLGDRRQPTVCVMMIDVQDVQTLSDHTLTIGDRSPQQISVNANLDDTPEVVLK